MTLIGQNEEIKEFVLRMLSKLPSMLSFPFVPSPITSPSAAEAARGGVQEGRLRRDEEVLDAPEELRQPVVGVGGTQEVQGREWLALYTCWISQDSHVPWSSRGGTGVSSGLVARQMEELEESFAAGPALQLSLFQDTSDWPLMCFCAEPQTS